MNIQWKGRLSEANTLPTTPLADEGIPLPKTGLSALWFLIPLAVFLYAFLYLKQGRIYIDPRYLSLRGLAAGFLFGVLLSLLHEPIHALAYPKEAKVGIYFAGRVKATGGLTAALTHSTYPVTKRRFLWIIIAPSVVLGLLPILLAAFVKPPFVAALFMMAGFTNLGSCFWDWQLAVKTIRAVAKDEYVVLSGGSGYRVPKAKVLFDSQKEA